MTVPTAVTTGPIALSEFQPVPAAVVRGHVDPGQIAGFLGAAYTDVLRLIGEQHRSPAGPPFARWTPTPDGFDVEAGFPVTAPIEPAGPVVAATLPGGPVVTAVHRGSYETVAETYDAVAEWMTAQGHRPTGTAWESYLDEPGTAEPRTVVNAPCAPA